MIERDYVSPDGLLRLLVRVPDGDITMGFDGFPSHTHGDILAALFGGSPEEAAERFIADIIANKSIIAIMSVSGVVRDVWITDAPEDNLRRCLADETVDFRYWDGSRVNVDLPPE
jgi:hypothetical protein